MNRHFFKVSVLSVLLSSWLALSAVAGNISVEVANAPESNLTLTLKAISSAKRNLTINIYEFTSAPIADAIAERIQAGVHVDILAENQIVGGISEPGKAVQKRLVAEMKSAGGSDHYFIMTSKKQPDGAKRRYRFDHAKYIVVDGESLLIGSENYSPSGQPAAGAKGNRGWEVFVHDHNIAQEYAQVFTADTSLAFNDIVDLTDSTQSAGNEKAAAAVELQEFIRRGNGGLAATAVEKITSPDTSESGLLALLNSAQVSIDIEQMTFASEWKNGSSPLFDAVVAAAKRGVKVRVLLNDETVFNRGQDPVKPKNSVTVKALNELGATKGLKVSAKIANLKAMGVDYIHNKGLLVDGNKTLISSINWDENSVLNNREAAVVITSAPIGQYFSGLFSRDWTASGGN